MHLYISAVSHGHERLIRKFQTLKRLANHPDITVLCRDNQNSQALKKHCECSGILYFPNQTRAGFATNNNLNFWEAKKLGMRDDDYFVLLNCDVHINTLALQQLIISLEKSKPLIAAPNLFLDHEHTIYDDNLRRYPSILTFTKNYLFNDRSSVIDKSKPSQLPERYWASGAFLAFTSLVYQQLDGMNERFFLYCEDIDICRRASKQGIPVTFLSNVNASHHRRRSSQRFLSRAFFWHVKSVFIYSLSSKRLLSVKGLKRHLPQ
ncbi:MULTISPECIES: glycosyltransferase family 2 protein [Vibrio]|uniref:glycosyltransferase family 2 protein n=1 Tax=Vibrio TaxID=662 RepID=UPI000DD5C92E|nr:glycosyltransferase family 2 protein [Vibrio variabilis]